MTFQSCFAGFSPRRIITAGNLFQYFGANHCGLRVMVMRGIVFHYVCAHDWRMQRLDAA